MVKDGKQKTGQLDHLALRGLCWPGHHWESLVSGFHSTEYFSAWSLWTTSLLIVRPRETVQLSVLRKLLFTSNSALARSTARGQISLCSWTKQCWSTSSGSEALSGHVYSAEFPEPTRHGRYIQTAYQKWPSVLAKLWTEAEVYLGRSAETVLKTKTKQMFKFPFRYRHNHSHPK